MSSKPLTTFDRMASGEQVFPPIIQATIVSSSISIFASTLIIISYIYLRAYHSDKANRVSLRCVFLSSIMNLINSSFDIFTLQQYSGTSLCKVSATITMVTRVMGATFLALVGINLVLVFVFNVVYTAKQLERIYYPCAAAFGFITAVVPIYDQLQSHKDLGYSDIYRCYYYTYYHRLFDSNNLLWIWFYSVLFFCILIAALCSLIASIKLLREHQTLSKKFNNSSLINVTSDAEVQEYIRKQSSIFRKVVSRCVLYPLVPLISNIWGFVNQIALLDPNIKFSIGYALSLLDTVFSSLQGFFVAIVFFSDPGMVEILSSAYKERKERVRNLQGPIRLTVSKRPLLAITRTSSYGNSFVEKPSEESFTETVGSGSTDRSTCCNSSLSTQFEQQVLRPPSIYSPKQLRRNSSSCIVPIDPDPEADKSSTS